MINPSWHIYSQLSPENGSPLPTKVLLDKNPLFTLIGTVKELGKMKTKHEDALDEDLKYYQNEVDFVQKIRLKSKGKTCITGTVEFMVCTNERCLPPKTQSFFRFSAIIAIQTYNIDSFYSRIVSSIYLFILVVWKYRHNQELMTIFWKRKIFLKIIEEFLPPEIFYDTWRLSRLYIILI
jgi:hypothetical protein